MKQFVKALAFILTLIIWTESCTSNGISLNDKFSRCNFPNCSITLHGGEHIVNRTLVLEGWNYFNLSASNQTIIRCNNMADNDTTIIRAYRTKYVSLENITFIGCSKPNLKVDQDPIPSIISTDFAYSIYMDSCYFPDYLVVGLIVNNTDSVVLTNSYFKAWDGVSYRRAVLYQNTIPRNASFYAHNITLDGGNVSSQIDLPHYHSYKSQEREIGGSLALFMYNIGSVYIKISNSTILNSEAVLGGGVFFEMSGKVTEYNIEIIDCHFENNIAVKSKIGKGGAMGIRAESKRGNIRIYNSTFQNNQAINGGAIAILLNERVGGSNIGINSSHFFNNTAKMDSGGAVYAENFYLSSLNVLNINNTEFYRNSANSGGAILTMNFLVYLLENVSIRDNIAYYGGGVCLLASTLILKGSNIVLEKNNATHSGGALYVHSSSQVVAYGNRTRITNNNAMIRGGGVFVYTKYFENQIHYGWNNWRDKGALFDINCFLIALKGSKNSLIFSGNNVTSNTELCMGDDLFTNTWGSCYSTFLRIPIKRAIVFKDRIKNNCSISLDIVMYSEHNHFLSPCQLDIQSGVSFTHNCSKILELDTLINYNMSLSQAIQRQGMALKGKAHLFFNGYKSQINIQSLDGLNNSIQTLTRIIFKSKNASFLDNKQYHVLGVSQSGKFNFEIKKMEDGFVFGEICLLSYSTLNLVHYCEDAIIGDCPSPLLRAGEDESCKIQERFHGNAFAKVKDSDVNKFDIQLAPGTLFYYTKNPRETIFKPCTWFQCKCHKSASLRNCTFNVNSPGDQCQHDLKFPYCTECVKPNHRICPPFSWFCYHNHVCFECFQPILMIIVYIIFTIIITAVICLLPIDVFSHYSRSIVFYSSTLYLLCINCGTFEKKFIYHILSIPIVIFNLLVSHMFPFCLPKEEPIYEAIFEMVTPLLFAFYIWVIKLALDKAPQCIAGLGKYGAVNKLWTIMVLTYVHLCNQAFSVLNCTNDSQNNITWLYDGRQRCLAGPHLVAFIIAIIVLSILVTFPIVMIILSYSKHKDFVLVYQERYKPGFRKVEMLKLYLRIIFALVVTLLPHVIKTPKLPCSLISIFCLALLILNSLIEPATNANMFESLCLFILAYVGSQAERASLEKIVVSLLVVIPYIIYLGCLIWTLGKWINEKVQNSKIKKMQMKMEKINSIQTK
ncbi:hypothetical protein LOD99_9435 [Oopsacas minuta]|uniref:Right handed beta helix domain-containing protein n=1 Tax=Oopsacas minuta TaxID=111878 RepID=A0AAV7JBN9_9METZ|nr:hypothetical protein LOD99_9435 [Oopsacas minuta]